VRIAERDGDFAWDFGLRAQRLKARDWELRVERLRSSRIEGFTVSRDTPDRHQVLSNQRIPIPRRGVIRRER
jgi:hypothetical protein